MLLARSELKQRQFVTALRALDIVKCTFIPRMDHAVHISKKHRFRRVFRVDGDFRPNLSESESAWTRIAEKPSAESICPDPRSSDPF